MILGDPSDGFRWRVLVVVIVGMQVGITRLAVRTWLLNRWLFFCLDKCVVIQVYFRWL